MQRAQTTSQTVKCHTGALSTEHIEYSGNQPVVAGHCGGTEGTDNQTESTVGTPGHWAAVNCTYGGHKQPVRQRAHSGAHWCAEALSTVHTEGISNQSDRGHTE